MDNYNKKPLVKFTKSAVWYACLLVFALVFTQALRAKGVYAECDIVGRSLKAQMKYADKIGARRTLILGESEIESGKAQLRNMEDGTQKEITLADAAETLLAEINA